MSKVISFKTEEVVKELDVSDKSDRQIEKIETGMQYNLDYEKYYTLIKNLENEFFRR